MACDGLSPCYEGLFRYKSRRFGGTRRPVSLPQPVSAAFVLRRVQMRVRPEHYRAQARRSRELAKHALNKEIAVHLLQVAEEYDKLAIEAERRE